MITPMFFFFFIDALHVAAGAVSHRERALQVLVSANLKG